MATPLNPDEQARAALLEYENRLHQLTLARVDREKARKALIPADLQQTLEDFDAETLPRITDLEAVLESQRDKVRSLATAVPIRSNDFILRLQATRSMDWDNLIVLITQLENSRSKVKQTIAAEIRSLIRQTTYGKIDPVRK